MIKAESYPIKHRANRRDIKIHVVTSINDDLKDIGKGILTSEVVAIFKHLHTIDPEILLDALEIYTEDLNND